MKGRERPDTEDERRDKTAGCILQEKARAEKERKREGERDIEREINKRKVQRRSIKEKPPKIGGKKSQKGTTHVEETSTAGSKEEIDRAERDKKRTGTESARHL